MTLLSTYPPVFSVIIPTYKRPRGLQACLEGLASVDYPRARYEVIVVDDGGRDVPEEAIASFRTRMQVRLLRSQHGGPAAARNAGAHEAAGEFLAFIDDDCIPAPDWLQALARGFSCAPNSLLGGHTVNVLTENPYSAASQLLIDYLYNYYGRLNRKELFFTSNNLAIPTKTFRRVGGFDVSFVAPAGEDREFCDRWHWHGEETRYVPEAVVYHAHDLSLVSFWHQHSRYGGAAYRFHHLRALRAARKIRLEPASFYLGLIRYPFRQAPVGQRGILVALLVLTQISNAIGYSREALGARLTRSRPEPTAIPVADPTRAPQPLYSADLHILYLSVTPDILDDSEHFRRIYLNGLGARVAQISYLVCAPSGTDSTPKQLNSSVTLFPVISRNRWHFIRQAFKMGVRLHCEQPFDLTVCMTPIAPAAAAYWFRRRTGVPFIVHWSHDFLGGWGWRLESPAHMLYWPWLRWITRRADSVRPIAKPLADSILKGGVPQSRVRLLPTLLHRNIFVPASHQGSGPNPFAARPTGERQLLFVGRLAKQKNLPLLLHTMADLRNQERAVHLWVVGDGELCESLRLLASALGLAEAVTFVGRVPLTGLQPYYARCDVFVLPSNHEGLARVLAEASLCAAPIVCTHVGGVVDHVQHGRTALVVAPNDAGALTSAITSLLDDRLMAHRLGDAARTLAEQQYLPIEQQYDRWVTYWAEVAASGLARG